MRGKQYKDVAIKYANDVIKGDIIASDDVINACKRFKEDLKRKDLELRTTQPDAAISIIEGVFVHRQGESMEVVPLLGQPFILQPWQIFIIYNLLGFWYVWSAPMVFTRKEPSTAPSSSPKRKHSVKASDRIAPGRKGFL